MPAELGNELSLAEARLQKEMRRVYQERLDASVAREQARKDLPLSTYTEAYWKIDLHNLLHFLHLRMDDHAQLEIRQYAQAIGHQIVQPLFPTVWDAFNDYRLNGMSLNRLDRDVMKRLIQTASERRTAPPFSKDAFLEAQDELWKPLQRCRERNECLAKLQELGIVEQSD